MRLLAHFAQWGSIWLARVAYDRKAHHSRSYGFVVYNKVRFVVVVAVSPMSHVQAREAQQALAHQTHVLDDCRITVKLSDPKAACMKPQGRRKRRYQPTAEELKEKEEEEKWRMAEIEATTKAQRADDKRLADELNVYRCARGLSVVDVARTMTRVCHRKVGHKDVADWEYNQSRPVFMGANTRLYLEHMKRVANAPLLVVADTNGGGGDDTKSARARSYSILSTKQKAMLKAAWKKDPKPKRDQLAIIAGLAGVTVEVSLIIVVCVMTCCSTPPTGSAINAQPPSARPPRRS